MRQISDEADQNDAGKTCATDCQSCHGDAAEQAAVGSLTGWRFGATAAGVFLLPLAAAMTGAVVAGPDLQLVGCLAGMAVGATVAVVTARMLGRRVEEHE